MRGALLCAGVGGGGGGGSLVAEVTHSCVIGKHSALHAQGDSPAETLAAPDNIFVELL